LSSGIEPASSDIKPASRGIDLKSRRRDAAPHLGRDVARRTLRLIVNADDLGGGRAVDDATFALMRRGLVTSATILANGPTALSAMRRALKYPDRSFGVHLNLTEFAPLTTDPGLCPILDPDGRFVLQGVRRVLVTPALSQAIFRELCAQIETVQRAGVPVSHLDGHHHVHAIPALLPVVKRIQRRYGLRRVRIAPNLNFGSRWALLRRARRTVWNEVLRRVYPTVTTDGFGALTDFLALASRSLPAFRSVEVMVHPGSPDDEPETRLLTESLWQGLPFDVQPISWFDL